MEFTTVRRLARAAMLAAGICLLLALAATAFAQKSAGGTINLDVADIELATVVRMLARDSGQNIIIADHEKSRSKVSATLTNVTLDTALRYIVESTGCTWNRKADGTYIIGGPEGSPVASAPDAEVRVSPLVDPDSQYNTGRYEGEKRRDVIFSSIKLQNTGPVDMMWLLGAYQPEQAFEIDKAANTPGARLPGARMIVPPVNVDINKGVHATPPLIDPIMSTVGEAQRSPTLDSEAGQGQPPFPGPRPQPNQPNQPNQGNQGNQNSQSLTPDGIDYLMPYPADNSLLVKGTPEGIEELHDLIKKLDIAPRQVSIKAEFVQVTTGQSSSLGIDWSVSRMGSVFETQFSPKGNVLFGYASGNVMANLRTQILSNKAKLVNAPIISTLNNIPANISISKQIPYWTSYATSTGDNLVTQQQLQMLQIQTNLMVIPRINGDGSITCTLSPQVADQGEMYTGPDGTEVPAVNQQSLYTTRRVMNGETIVVGGIIRKTENNSSTGIPLLKDLPIIGPLFTNRNKSTDDVELLIFLTPTIVPERSTVGSGVGVAL